MTDFSPEPVQLPSLAKSITTSLIRQGLTWLAGILVTSGALASDQSAQFVTVLSGVALGLVSVVWSIAQKKLAQNRLASAVVAPAAKVAP